MESMAVSQWHIRITKEPLLYYTNHFINGLIFAISSEYYDQKMGQITQKNPQNDYRINCGLLSKN
jgi:hypothetical protein